MNGQTMAEIQSGAGEESQGQRMNWERAGVVYARCALGAAFLSAVAARFGLWKGSFDLNHFASFIEYAGEVNSFLPRAVIPLVAWAATLAETSCGVLLILGLWPKWVSLASAILLGHVWDGDGDIVRHQVADGLLGIFGFGRGSVADVAGVPAEQSISFYSELEDGDYEEEDGCIDRGHRGDHAEQRGAIGARAK